MLATAVLQPNRCVARQVNTGGRQAEQCNVGEAERLLGMSFAAAVRGGAKL